ncbi:Abi-alpha family protein [Cellvibrio mixtus]|uniref:Abi-alpha family protein n=1 Tax=Cellvibrio mixtus TaxID=39650 RepID=UPI000587884E|nr:Abi-alpha family protein [Cellvibrio mixtus]
MGEVEETAKAVQEVAKTTSNALDKGAELSRFIGKVIGPAIEDLGAIAKQYTEYWKIKNALSLNDKFERVLAKRGNPSLSSLPLRTGLPLLDAAVLEDEDSIQIMWANLLASAMSEECMFTVAKSYVEVLKQLDLVDAELIEAIYRMHLQATLDKTKSTYINPKKTRSVIQISFAVNNLERLGLIKLHAKSEKKVDDTVISIFFLEETSGKERSFSMNVSCTLFGIYFMRACTDHKLQSKDGGEFVPIEDRFDYHGYGDKS